MLIKSFCQLGIIHQAGFVDGFIAHFFVQDHICFDLYFSDLVSQRFADEGVVACFDDLRLLHLRYHKQIEQTEYQHNDCIIVDNRFSLFVFWHLFTSCISL